MRLRTPTHDALTKQKSAPLGGRGAPPLRTRIDASAADAGPKRESTRNSLTQPLFSERLLVNIITKHAAGPGPISAAHGASSICRHGRHGGGPRSAAEGRRLISRPQQGGLR